MIKNDKWILEKASEGMIVPYLDHQIKTISTKILSYGVGSYGYDVRLSPTEFRLFNRVPGEIIDPKNFKDSSLKETLLIDSEYGNYFILPAHSYGLGVSVEKIKVPDNVTVICIGKSTYARCGIMVNVTPLKAGWEGYITLEVSNSSNSDCKIYANEGIVQLLFFEGEPCNLTYGDLKGKYQNQENRVVFAR